MPKLTYSDDLELIVTGANISGMLEHNNCIYVPSDCELTMFLVKKLNDYQSTGHADNENWTDFIMDELALQYGKEV